MNLNDVLERDNFDQKVSLQQKFLNGIAIFLNQMLSAVGILLFWVFMIALITSPAWVPAVVDGLFTR